MSDDRIAQIVAEARAEIAQCNSADQIESLRVKYLGRKSAVVAVLRGLKDLDGEQRKAVGQQANEAKEQIEQLLADHQKLLTDHQKIVGDHQALMGNHQAVTAQLKSFEDWAAEEAEEHEDGESTLTATLTASFGGKKPETQVVLAALSNKRKTLATFRKDVLEIAGGKDGDTVVGTLTAWKSQSEELVATKATVEKERTERLTSDFKSKLTALSTGKAPRITPAHRKACEELLTNKGLEAAQQALSVLAPGDTGPAIVATEEIPQPGANQDQMIPEAIKFCTASNIDPKAFVKSGVYLQSAEYKDAVERLGRR